jgi:hypothetical protein
VPFGTVVDPIYASASSNEIVGYTRCGDSALWTGVYLAAEAFRYNVTRSADALTNVKNALAGLKALTDVTGNNQIARCMLPAASPFAAGIEREEAHNGIHYNSFWVWVGNTSRNQVVGVFFGLGIAYDVVDDVGVQSAVGDLATRLIGFITRHQWSPDDDISISFEFRPESFVNALAGGTSREPFQQSERTFFCTSGRNSGAGRCSKQQLVFQIQPGLHEPVPFDPLAE